MTWDIVIHRGLLIDGSGSQGTIADIALAAGRIAGIGPSLPGDTISDQVVASLVNRLATLRPSAARTWPAVSGRRGDMEICTASQEGFRPQLLSNGDRLGYGRHCGSAGLRAVT